MEAPILCKGFMICSGRITPGESFEISVEDTKKDGMFSQINYCIEGEGTLYNASGNLIDSFCEGDDYDMREQYGKGYKYVVPDDLGGSWFCINPLPATKIYDYEVLNEGTKIVVGDGIERTVICMIGSITINDKTLSERQYARVLDGKVANIEVTRGSKALYFWDSGKKQVK